MSYYIVSRKQCVEPKLVSSAVYPGNASPRLPYHASALGLALNLLLRRSSIGSFCTIIIVFNLLHTTLFPGISSTSNAQSNLQMNIRISAHARPLPKHPVGPTLKGLLAARWSFWNCVGRCLSGNQRSGLKEYGS